MVESSSAAETITMAMIQTRSVAAPSPRRFVLIFGRVVIAIAVMAFVLGRVTAPAADEATALLQAVGTKGAQATWLQSAPMFRQTVPDADWQGFIADHRLGDVRSMRWNDRAIRDDHALIKGWITTSDGSHYTTMMLDKVDGQWRMVAIRVDRDQLGSFGGVFWR